MEYRVYLAGPTSILELRVRGIDPNNSGIEEDGNYWLDDLMIPPERLIAIVREEDVLSARELPGGKTSPSGKDEPAPDG